MSSIHVVRTGWRDGRRAATVNIHCVTSGGLTPGIPVQHAGGFHPN